MDAEKHEANVLWAVTFGLGRYTANPFWRKYVPIWTILKVVATFFEMAKADETFQDIAYVIT